MLSKLASAPALSVRKSFVLFSELFTTGSRPGLPREERQYAAAGCDQMPACREPADAEARAQSADHAATARRCATDQFHLADLWFYVVLPRHVCVVYDFFTHDTAASSSNSSSAPAPVPLQCLVMELVHENLSVLRRATAMRPSQGIAYSLLMLQALHEFHVNGWLHRDIKPVRRVCALGFSLTHLLDRKSTRLNSSHT